MEMISIMQSLNPELDILPVESSAFKQFGCIVEGYDFSELIDQLENTSVPEEGTTYLAEVEKTRSLRIYQDLSRHYYGDMPIQIGFGGGYNLSLNALEWHRGSEVIVALTDFLVMLSRVQDIHDGKIDSSLVETFYLEKGQAVELYATTLHYSPCQVDSNPFRMIVVLPEGTNTPLTYIRSNTDLLLAKNKWLIAHPDAIFPENEMPYFGITGQNLKVKI